MHIPEEIKTDRLILRKLLPEDKLKFLEFMRDNEATQYLMFREEQKSTDGANQLFDYILNAYNSNNPIFTLAIAEPKWGYIGSCGISRIEEGIWECYYSLNREFWGKGYAPEALESLKNYCFNHLNIHELRAYMSPENINSARVAEKIGMTYKGIQTHPVFKKEAILYKMENS